MAQPTKFLAPFLCLPMNEALTSGLPVIMSNVSPTDAILPQEWLVPDAFNGGLTLRVPIQYFNAKSLCWLGSRTSWRPCPTTFLINRRQERLSYRGNGPGGVASPVRGGAGGV
jgi:hypothetical protein